MSNGPVPVDVLHSKLYRKAEKLLGRERAKELLQKSDADLKSVIGECVAEVGKMEAEMKGLQDFKKAQDVIKTLRGGLRDTAKPHKTTADLAKAIIQSRNS